MVTLKDQMTDTPFFSIITPTYKRPDLLRRAIMSVRAQTFQDWEMCIVDNTSPDNTLEVIAEFNDPRLRVQQINNDGIIAKSRNKSMSMARGQFYAFLDADDWWTSDKLEQAARVFQAEVDVFYHNLEIVSEEKSRKRRPRLGAQALTKPVQPSLAVLGGVMPNSSVVVRRSLCEKVGPISEDPDLVAVEDYDYWLRCSAHSDAFLFYSAPLGFYWQAGDSMTQASRTLKWGAALRKKYPSLKFPWLSYALAKANYDEGFSSAAIDEIEASERSQLRPEVRLRMIALRLLLWGRMVSKTRFGRLVNIWGSQNDKP